MLILIDDLSHYGVTAYGANRLHSYDGEFTNKEFETPNIDELAKGGLRFDRAFAYPICENSRIALMSGKVNHRNYLRPKAQHSSDITFGDAFKRAGYVTGLFGKWKQTRGSNETPGKEYISEFGWDDYAAFDVIMEGQRFINPNLVINGEVFNYNGRKDLDPETGRRWYGPDIVNRHALKFIEENHDKPFFLYYPMILVHDDHKPTPDTKPNAIFDNFPENADYNNTRGDDRQYFPDMIEYMDKLIGKVVAKLEEQKVREKTLIVVMGDNATKETFGHILPDGTIYPGRKGGNADNGLHVPLVVNYPGVVPHSDANGYRAYDGLTYITDIYPTIADAAGVKMPNKELLDGISFWPQATGDKKEEHRDHIYSWFIGNNPYTKAPDVAIEFAFDKHFKRYAASKEFPKGRFFDLRLDPLERKGVKVVRAKWGIERYSGLALERLTPEQRMAYNRLGQILGDNRHVPVEELRISASRTQLEKGETLQLSTRIFPGTASRQGVIWESSDPKVLSVNKFGEVTAHKSGDATITIYSWDDAFPVANNREPSYLKNGLHASVQITVN